MNSNFLYSSQSELNWKIDTDWTPNRETTTIQCVWELNDVEAKHFERQSRKILIDCGREYSTTL